MHFSGTLPSTRYALLLIIIDFVYVYDRMKKENRNVTCVILRLAEEYPGDLGVLMPLVLNLLMLKKGQSFFMAVDEPHGYLRGDVLEVRYGILWNHMARYTQNGTIGCDTRILYKTVRNGTVLYSARQYGRHGTI